MNLVPDKDEVLFILDNFDSDGRCYNPHIHTNPHLASLHKKCCVKKCGIVLHTIFLQAMLEQ